ncbi:hypothetical protein KRX19_00560 [Cardiobacteriaceae bacterium TAE3-ERU3]|nr:hypothetical protein [Cardiobacteriaceae bacterium TAE3-ERU3]
MSVAADSKKYDIDMLDMLMILWKKKITILLWCVLFFLLAIFYVVFAPKKWSSHAVVTVPTVIDISDYLSEKKDFFRLSTLDDEGRGQSSSHNSMNQNLEFSNESIAEQVFGVFQLVLRSEDFRGEFFMKSERYKQILDKYKPVSEEEKQKILAKLLRGLRIQIEEQSDNQSAVVKLSFTDSDPKSAQRVLNHYLEKVNEYAFMQDKNELLILAQQYAKQISTDKGEIEALLKSQKDNQLEQLSEALRIAKKSNLVDADNALDLGVIWLNTLLNTASASIVDFNLENDSQMWMFLLGERFLQAQLDVLTEGKINYPSSFYLLEVRQGQLEKLIAAIKAQKEVPFYRILASPGAPLTPDSPKKVTILLLPILGLFLGVVFVLLNNAIVQRKVAVPCSPK